MRELANDPGIASETLTFPYPQPEGWAEERIRKGNELFEGGTHFPWAVTLRSGEIVGYVVLSMEKRHRKADLGYWTGKAFRGQAYAKEAAEAVIQFALGTLALYRVEAGVFPRNSASIRVLEKLGMRKEGLLRAYVFRNDKPEDVAIYSILRTDRE